MDKERKNYFEMLHVLAKRSKCLRRQNAAVIVTRDGCVISSGYNGPPRKIPHCDETGCLREELHIPSGQRLDICIAAHAEENALIQAARHGIGVNGCTMYVIYSPCFHCTKLLINAGIFRVVSEHEYFDPLASELMEDAKKIPISFEIENPFFEKQEQFNSIIILGWIGSGKTSFARRIVDSHPIRFTSFPEAGGEMRVLSNETWEDYNPLFESAVLYHEGRTYEKAYWSLCNLGKIPVIEGGFVHDTILAIMREKKLNQDENRSAKLYSNLFLSRIKFWNKLLSPLYIVQLGGARQEEAAGDAYHDNLNQMADNLNLPVCYIDWQIKDKDFDYIIQDISVVSKNRQAEKYIIGVDSAEKEVEIGSERIFITDCDL